MNGFNEGLGEMILAFALTLVIISYLIYWYFFEVRPDQIRM